MVCARGAARHAQWQRRVWVSHVMPGGQRSTLPPSAPITESHGTPHAPDRDVKGHAHGEDGACLSASTATQRPELKRHADDAHHSVAAHCAFEVHVLAGTQTRLAASQVYATGQPPAPTLHVTLARHGTPQSGTPQLPSHWLAGGHVLPARPPQKKPVRFLPELPHAAKTTSSTPTEEAAPHLPRMPWSLRHGPARGVERAVRDGGGGRARRAA